MLSELHDTAQHTNIIVTDTSYVHLCQPIVSPSIPARACPRTEHTFQHLLLRKLVPVHKMFFCLPSLSYFLYISQFTYIFSIYFLFPTECARAALHVTKWRQRIELNLPRVTSRSSAPCQLLTYQCHLNLQFTRTIQSGSNHQTDEFQV